MTGTELIMVHEPERACRDRLIAQGFVMERAGEVASYLAQSTDIAREIEEIKAACAAKGITFRDVELDDAPAVLADASPDKTLVWTITDGIAYFRGGVAPALARLHGLKTMGSDDTLFALCQDKFRSGAVLGALGLPVPAAGLARNGAWLLEPPKSETGWFVKPNRLGAKIGIWPDSHCQTLTQALDLSRRIYAAYRDDAIVQTYVPGRNVRTSFLAVDPQAGPEKAGMFFVDFAGDFQTMNENISLYGEQGEAAKTAGAYAEPKLATVGSSQPGAEAAIQEIVGRLMGQLGLRDVFSVDLRVEADGTAHLIEFEICPGLPCFYFRTYCQNQWGMSLAEAMAASAARRFATVGQTEMSRGAAYPLRDDS